MNNLAAFSANGYGILLFGKLIFGAVAVFFGILTWRKTRKSYMVFFIFGIFSMYISILLQAARYFGFIATDVLNAGVIPVGDLFFETLPILFFIISLCLFLKTEDM